MAYLLRHDPSGMEISKEGFVDLEALLGKLRDRWPNLGEEDIRRLVEEDPKGRYEIKNDKVRARYGHSLNVSPTLSEAKMDTLYHGTTSQVLDKILEEGLKPKGRQKVHLSTTIEGATQVGKRRTNNPVILEIDVKKARKIGIRVERASDKVFVADEIPPELISVKTNSSS